MTQNNVQLQNGNGPLAGLRNQLINGNFEVWQRTSSPQTGIVVPANITTFTADRWSLTSSASFTSRQGVSSWEGTEVNDMSLVGMSARTWIGTTIELDAPSHVGQFGTGSKWQLSLISDSNSPPEQLLISFSNKSGAGRTESANLSYTPWALVETSGSYKRYATEITIDQNAEPSSVCLYLQFRFSDATTSVSFSNVQLEPGPVVTPFEKRPIGLELSLCQRYFSSDTGGRIRMYVPVANDPTKEGMVFFPVKMRIQPTVTALVAGKGSGDPTYVVNAVSVLTAQIVQTTPVGNSVAIDSWTADAEL